MRYFILLFLWCSSLVLSAQTNIERVLSKTVKGIDGQEFTNPWVGGMNSVHLAEIDLNFDGIKDLFVYDLEGRRVSTYLNNGTPNEVDYQYAPEYISEFSLPIENFIQFTDYNNDGKNDLFIAYNGGLKVFKNVSTPADGLKFEEYDYKEGYPYLTSLYDGTRSNLFVTRLDAPAIADVDFDGDLDVLSFSNSGGSVFYFQNQAAQNGNLEEFDFDLATSCWGNFEEDFNSEKITLGVRCKGNISVPKDKRGGNKHAGSTLLAFDADGDFDMDLLVGDVASNKMVFLTNGGDSLAADMVEQTTNFPDSVNPIDIQTFPSPHLLDVNNDGVRDLIISPNTLGSVENAQSIWYYRNYGTNQNADFKFEMADLLQKEMIDVGEGANPVFHDFDLDSIPDLFIGSYGKYNGIMLPLSGLTLLKTNADMDFELFSSDFGEISELILNTDLESTTLGLIPTFGDLDNDGDADMIVGDFVGNLHYFENIADPGQPANLELRSIDYQDIDPGGYASPQLFDLNEDGLLDLILGERDGILTYYENTGTASEPIFELTKDSLGGVVVVPENFFQGFSYPFFFHSNDTLKLICGSQSGKLFYYDNIAGNLNGKFNLVTDELGGIDVGDRSTIAGADIDSDGLLDLAVGNYAGGISFFKTNINYQFKKFVAPEKQDNFWSFILAPVPSSGLIQLLSNNDDFIITPLDVRVIDALGREVYSKQNITQKTFDLSFLPTGIYQMQVEALSRTEVRKFIIAHDN